MIRRAATVGVLALLAVCLVGTEATAASFSNPAPIEVPLPEAPEGCPNSCPSDRANPYPSTITVSGLTGTVTNVNLTLHDVTYEHNGLADADIMVVAPDGKTLMLMSDACGSSSRFNPVKSPITLTFDDEAAGAIPANTACAGGAYQPLDDDGDEEFPFHEPDGFPGGPKAPNTTMPLSALNGSGPNGTWSLYVVDDHPNDPDPNGRAGRIGGGWSLDIVTSTSAPATTAAPTTTAAPATTTTRPPAAPPPDLPPVEEVPVSEPPPGEPELRPGDLVFEPATEETGFFGDDPPIPAAVGAAVVLAVALGAISLRRRARSRRPLGRR